MMQPKLLYIHHCLPSPVFTSYPKSFVQIPTLTKIQKQIVSTRSKSARWKPSRVVATPRFMAVSASLQPLDLTEGNVKLVLSDARAELAQLFDASVGMTGVVELVELDGPFVKISLRGRFWHKRSTVLERIANYLKQRIPEILEVDIEDEKQLDDSPENF